MGNQVFTLAYREKYAGFKLLISPAWIRILFLLTTACLALQVTADDVPTTSKEDNLSTQPAQQLEPIVGDASRNQEETIEEITVIGQKYISTLRIQIIKAEDHAYDIFNALNDDDDYDVHCRMEARIGTLIKKRVCLPNFYDKATADDAQVYLGLIGGSTNYIPAAPSASSVFALKFPIFKSKVKKLALENPELLDAVRELFEINEELRRVRNAYHGTREK